MQPNLSELSTPVAWNLPVPLPSQHEMAAFDKRTIESGTSALALMDRAGRELYLWLRRHFAVRPGRPIPWLIGVGTGNNGGDGLVIAQWLQRAGLTPSVVIASSERCSEEFLTQLGRFEEMGGLMWVFPEGPRHTRLLGKPLLTDAELASQLQHMQVFVDALLGTGQRGEPRDAIGAFARAVEQHRHDGLSVVSVDVPTGINADNGVRDEPSLVAQHTVCIEAVKRGLLQYPARGACGALDVVTIGIDTRGQCEYRALTPDAWPGVRWAGDTHKGTRGRVAVIGGSVNFPGAPVLSAHSAISSGAGLVTLYRPSRSWIAPPAILMNGALGKEADFFGPEHADEARAVCAETDAVVCGPGIGRADETRAWLLSMLQHRVTNPFPLVIDADALNLVRAEELELLKGTIVTPHPGEAARMLSRDVAAVQRDRYGAARELARKTGAIVVLKGAGTIIYADERGYVCPSSQPRLATAGSGDVLAGIIGALLGVFGDPVEAAAAAVYAHARAGEELGTDAGKSGFLTAQHLIDGLGPIVASTLESGRKGGA